MAEAAASILVVDDDADIRDALCDLLAVEGYATRSAADGVEALAALRSSPADLVLLDLMMPRLNGWQVLEQMRSEAALSGIPVIVISAATGQLDVRGATAILPKPISVAELLDAVAHACSGSGRLTA